MPLTTRPPAAGTLTTPGVTSVAIGKSAAGIGETAPVTNPCAFQLIPARLADATEFVMPILPPVTSSPRSVIAPNLSPVMEPFAILLPFTPAILMSVTAPSAIF